MKRLILIISAAIISVAAAFAQETSIGKYGMKPVQLVEGDIFIGVNYPFETYAGYTSDAGASFGGEIRFNLRNLPIDLGTQISFTCLSYRTPKGYTQKEHNNTLVKAIAVCDWNFQRGHKFNPFLGVGFGAADYDNFADSFDESATNGISGTCPIFIIRGGIEMFTRLRITLNADICKTSYSNICLTVGYTFGGRAK